MDTVKGNLQKNAKRIEEKLDRTEESVKALEANMAARVEQLNKQEESNRQLKTDNAEMKKSLDEITKHLVRMTQQISHGVQDEQLKKGIAEAGGVKREPKVVLAGGYNNQKRLNSVEMFSLATGTWTRLQPMEECRYGGSAVVHNNQMFVVKGCYESMEKLSLNAVHVDQSIPWENVPIELPGRLAGHCCVVYKGRLVMIGGYDAGKITYSNCITEFSLISPYHYKLLASMAQARCYHGAAIFGDKILIFGGRENANPDSALSSVVMFDITENKCRELAPLPYPIQDMATAKWGDDNVMIMGGTDNTGQPSNKVLMYNIKSEKSHELPEMKFRRRGCAAAVVNDTVIVTGGKDGRNHLKSVESFRFDRYSWEELADMHDPRWRATAVTC
jgi:regulator of replication initiation timing